MILMAVVNIVMTLTINITAKMTLMSIFHAVLMSDHF